MNLTLAALLGMTLGQAPAADYYPLNSRNIKLPIQYQKDRKLIRQVLLFVSEDHGNTWHQKAEAPPDRDAFSYTAPKDGQYWFHIVTVDLRGTRDPANLTAEPPAQKALVDTTPPQVRFTSARRLDSDVVVEWVVDDQYPDHGKTRVYFRPAGSEGYWQEVTVDPRRRDAVQFPVGTAGPVMVKVEVQDLAGNKNEAQREVPAAGANTQMTASLSPAGTGGSPAPPARPAAGGLPPPMDLSAGGPGPLAPTGPVAPSAPPAAYQPPAPAVPLNPAPAAPAGPAVQPSPPPLQPPTGPAPAAVFQGTPHPTAPPAADPHGPVTPAAQHAATTGGPTPAAVFTSSPTTPSPTVELSRIQAIRFLRFDLSYQVEQQGPSGVSRVDLWVTRDDGQTWVKWSHHDARDPAIHVALDRVALDSRRNPQPEGLYGFRLVPVSGAGLSDREPARGDAPELRVLVDLTPPRIEWYPPAADPNDPGVLILQWRATDANFADDPITVEWSEKATGPWVSVAAGFGDGGLGNPPGAAPAHRLPNTGRYAWRVPAGLPPRVYFRITARDAAGNVQSGVDGPTLIDLAKPRARIKEILVSPPTIRQ